MKEEITDEQLIELIDGMPNRALENSIKGDPKLRKRFDQLREVLDTIKASGEAEVPAHIKMNVQQAIVDERSRSSRSSTWMQVAAAVTLLIIGFGTGRFAGNTSTELTELKNEISALKDLTLTSTLSHYSASERIMAVNQIDQSAHKINPKLISTLTNTLNSDESPNVRYAALQALANYINNEDVRAELVKSLESQSDPLIQISLINILVEAEERSAIAPLKDIIDKEEISPEVKQQAEIAIEVLT